MLHPSKQQVQVNAFRETIRLELYITSSLPINGVNSKFLSSLWNNYSLIKRPLYSMKCLRINN